MTKTYTIMESIEALGVDPKTFRKWLDRANFDRSGQVSKIDQRVKYLTEGQVQQIATDHGRPWPPQPRPSEQEKTGTPGTLKLLQDRIELLEQKVSDQAAQISDLITQIQSMNRSRGTQRRQTSANDIALDDISEMEPGLVSATAFVQAHGINPGTAKSAFQSGRVPVIRGRWKQGIKIALDDKGRARFWQLYHNSLDWQACQGCPHLPQDTTTAQRGSAR